LLFEAYSMLLAEKLPIEQARQFLRISHTSLTNIVAYWVGKRVAEDDLSKVTDLNIDETSFKKGQSYVTVVCDAAARRVIDVEEGRTAQQVYPKTGRAFRMVQSLDVMYACYTAEEADQRFKQLISWLKRSRLGSMKRAAATLLEHKPQIMAYFLTRLTNAIAEGINSLIQTGKRKARGFRTFRGYSTMIYLTCSKLDFAPVQLFA
jgi:transposase